MTETIWKHGYTQNRELSWLQFNARLLDEAEDENVPLLERLKFLAIFTSNLDEFFMIRVGSLGDIAAVDKTGIDNKSGLTASQQLDKIYETVTPLYKRRDKIFTEAEEQLGREGLVHVPMNELTEDELEYIRQYFHTTIQPVLSPQIVDSHHPFPHLSSKVIHVGLLLSKNDSETLGLIPIPTSLPTIIRLDDNTGRYVLLEDILYFYANTVFNMYDVLEKVLFCITRNADINLDDEPFAPDGPEMDVRTKMEKLLRLRKNLNVVRLELTCSISDHFTEYFLRRFNVTKNQIFVTEKAPLILSYLFDSSIFIWRRRNDTSLFINFTKFIINI